MKGFTFINYLFLGMIAASVSAEAAVTIQTRIHEVLTDSDAASTARVLSTVDGRVYEVAADRQPLVRLLREASVANRPMHLTLEGDRVLEARVFSEEEARAYSDPLLQAAPDSEPEAIEFLDAFRGMAAMPPNALGYQASNLSSMGDANYYFSILKALSHRSQCYQRAHYWARQMYFAGNVNSMKVFLFFTRKFVREHRFKWWFHVAPFVYVQGQEVVLDPEFVDDPKSMQAWTDFFMMDRKFVKPPLYSNPVCPEVASFPDYENNQESQLCYVLKLPMYYYQPLDAERLALEGKRVEYWRQWDSDHSKKAEKWF